MTRTLCELTEEGRTIVEEHLEEGGRVTGLDDAVLDDHSVEIRGLDADLEELRDELDQIRADIKENGLEIEVRAAPHVHQYLDLSRREAAVEGLWHWLAVAEFPEFVYHRWEGYEDTVGKFLEGRTNIYSNAIHRLWWIAELTYDHESADPYSRTERVFAQGTLTNDVFDRWFARYGPAAKVIVDELDGEPASAVIDPTTKNIKDALSNYKLELMTQNEICELVAREYENSRSE